MRAARVLLTASLLVTTALALPATAHAMAPAAAPVIGAVPTPDVIAVGIPDADGGTGAVDVHLPGGAVQRLTPAGLDLAPVAGMTFGSSVVTADINRDGLTDLLIGASGAWPKGGPGGRAWIVQQGASGFQAAGVRTLASPGAAADGFGHALAVSGRFDPGRADVGSDLWVGAPGTRVAGHHDAGAIYRYRISTAGRVSAPEKISQNSAHVPGRAEAGDSYGEVLAPAENGVLVGVPHEALGSKMLAGAVDRLFTDRSTQDLRKVVGVNQDTPDVPGAAEAGDEFGAAVAEGSGQDVVGVPGEDLGSARNAGAVERLTIFDDFVGSDSLLTQDSRGIPGHVEAGDRFGAAIVFGRFTCYEEASLAIGAPGEDVGDRRDAGMVIVAPPVENGCNTVSLVQGGELPGVPETGDETGAALGTVSGTPGADPDEVFDTLLVGVPGETAGGAAGSGRVVAAQLRHEVAAPVPPAVYTSFGPISGDEVLFGSVLGLAG